ncbi:inovirus Gp2 family protein [Halopseudomonas pelagia]|uniref:inovirus Gp2 family protein n=1 Tax=Halopseudomonas pelagia TaxID=553151 RepID=UPI0003A73AA4|nr:inovirus Gp2 family protein [Halopseudomonas pelagia]
MIRHPHNTNLRLHYDNSFEGLSVMVDKGPFIEQYLSRLKRTIELALDEYPRLLAFRVDLRLPAGADLPVHTDSNVVISRFIDSFKAKIRQNRLKAFEHNEKGAHDSRVRYVWAREVGQRERPHYHLLILLNRDAFYTLGKLDSTADNMISRMQEAWASALGLPVEHVRYLVHIPDNPMYRVDLKVKAGKPDRLPELFYRTSYLCKAATKSYGSGHWGFGTSRG